MRCMNRTSPPAENKASTTSKSNCSRSKVKELILCSRKHESEMKINSSIKLTVARVTQTRERKRLNQSVG